MQGEDGDANLMVLTLDCVAVLLVLPHARPGVLVLEDANKGGWNVELVGSMELEDIADAPHTAKHDEDEVKCCSETNTREHTIDPPSLPQREGEADRTSSGASSS